MQSATGSRIYAGLVQESKRLAFIVAGLSLLLLIAYVGHHAAPLSREGESVHTALFEIKPGDSFGRIAHGLEVQRLIRSRRMFTVFGVLRGSATKLKPGVYRLNSAMSGSEILDRLVAGERERVRVTIPEGSSVYDIDRKLGEARVIEHGALVRFAEVSPIEGKLFPDTYVFFVGSRVQEVVNIFLSDFEKKAAPLLKEGGAPEETLILASLLEKEVPDFEDQKIVAGILEKRLRVGMLLQVDATVCYAVEAMRYPEVRGCYPLTPLDFKNPSPYNTYVHRGLPPAPIANPGVRAIIAALHPKASPYWFYLSDPLSRETIWSKDIDEHGRNRLKYLQR